MQMYVKVDTMGTFFWRSVIVKRNNLLLNMQLHLG